LHPMVPKVPPPPQPTLNTDARLAALQAFTSIRPPARHHSPPSKQTDTQGRLNDRSSHSVGMLLCPFLYPLRVENHPFHKSWV